MNIIKTNIPDLLIIEPDVFKDERGYFFESYNKKKYTDAGINIDFVQDNQSQSSFGVIRGLHYQLAPYSQTKLVSVIEGEVFDVAVDIRKNSPTFGKWFGLILSEENKKQFFIPKGFAHGFSVLSDIAIFTYKCDNFYNKEAERSIMFNDSEINIDWKINSDNAIISLKDKINPTFDKAEMNFIYGKM
ncbi:MAG: dTDP-4-dehydrorhamnose 3,5-epimerase [Bacteroidales bacterium]|nr:dTDP-4-dehydrorhamnose 3,5-epimerase [Bacteroidales bacterium]